MAPASQYRAIAFGVQQIFSHKVTVRSIDKNDKIHELKFLSYESPLIRKKVGNLNNDIGNPFARCDLIALYKINVSALEVKIEPYSISTRLPFALLESFFYGHILNRISKEYNKTEIISEIAFCAKEFGLKKYNLTDYFEINYYVGAPKSYFFGYLIDKNDKLKKYLFTQTWLSETKNIERAISRLNGIFPRFGGYIVIGKTEMDVKDKGQSKVPVPILKYSKFPNSIYYSITDLIDDFKNQRKKL